MQCSLNEEGQVILRVATNSLPDHCIISTSASQFPQENLIDFEVAFNSNTDTITKALTTQEEVNSYMCDNIWLRDENIGVEKYYQGFTGLREHIVGIAFNGVPIYQGTSELKYDPFYPRAYGEEHIHPTAIEVDACLGSYDHSGFYHYYSYSPCIKQSSIKQSMTEKPTLCKDDASCQDDVFNYTLAALDQSQKTLKKIGVARDGNFILGPYNAQGQLWSPCELDACNGITIDGEYFYASTTFHPYTVGCWGKSEQKRVAEECSSNTKVCHQKLQILLTTANSDANTSTYLSMITSTTAATMVLIVLSLF